MAEENVKLGEKIELVGFRELDKMNNSVINKMIGNYANKYENLTNNFENLKLTLKNVHETESNKKLEIHANLSDNGSVFTAESVNRNLFFCLDEVLRKLKTQLES